jgi:hypothetical protein
LSGSLSSPIEYLIKASQKTFKFDEFTYAMLGTTDCSASDIVYTKSVSPSNPTSGSPSIPLVSFDSSRLLPDQTPNPDFLQFSIETSDVTLAAKTYTVTLTGKITTVDSSGAPVVT